MPAYPLSESGLRNHSLVSAADESGWAAMHQNSPGHPVIADVSHAAISAESLTAAQWLAHHAASHLI
jgi:hypothetical protein